MENTILLIGLGINRYKINEIIEFTNLDEIEKRHGVDSCFYKAGYEAFKCGADKLYILNLDDWEDIKDLKEILEDLSFDYVVPLDLYIDDIYYDKSYEKRLTYSQVILATLKNTISTVIMTGKHASEFEDLDSYLQDEKDRLEKSEYRMANLRTEGFIYVSNLLTQINYANLLLAVILSKTEYGEYPNPNNVISITNRPVFDIDYSDIKNVLVYFKENTLTGVTLENLVNFSASHILRLIPVYKILKYFHYHKADMDDFIGTAYSEYRRLKIQERLKSYLENLVDYIIYRYEILSITTVSSEYGSVDILLRYAVWPKFTTERYVIETTL